MRLAGGRLKLVIRLVLYHIIMVNTLVILKTILINLLCTVEQGGAESIDNPMHEAAKRGMRKHTYLTSV